LLTACAGTKEKMSMVEDPGSPAKVALLRERVETFWTAFTHEDYEKAFYLYDPFFRVNTNKHLFLGRIGTVKYKLFEIKDINVDGNVAHVIVGVVYSVPPVKYKKMEFSQPETYTAIEDTWLYIYDNWYKEYKTEVESNAGLINY
jgi:hypothetical protein